MLDDNAGGFGKGLDALKCRIGVCHIVIGQLLALQLLRAGYRHFRWLRFLIEGCLLMGVFAVAHILHLVKLHIEGAWETGLTAIGIYFAQVVGNRAIVVGGVFKGFYRQIKAGGAADAAGLDFADHPRIVCGVNHNAYILMVLGGGAHHGGAADIDILDRIIQCAVGFGNGGFEGVEVDYHQVNGVYAVEAHYFIINTATPQNAAVNFWMQGLYPAVHHFRKAGVRRDFSDWQIVFGE